MTDIYRVAQVLDRSTVTITGPIENIWEGVDLVVVAIGAIVPGTTERLVIPKARLEVTSTARTYAVAQSKERSRTVERPTFAILSMTERHTVREREKLNVLDKELVGNPAAGPIRVGDVVIKKEDLKEFAAAQVDDSSEPSAG